VKIKVIIPFPMDQEGVRNRAAQVSAADVLPDTEVVFVPVKNSASTADSPYDVFVIEMFVFEEGLRSEEEGYDAVCIDSISDSALAPLRSRLRIPVVGPGQTGWYLASMLGKKFSIITLSDSWVRATIEFVDKYNLGDKLASVRGIGKTPDLRNLLGGDTEILQAIERASRQAIEEDHADVIVLGSTTMHEAYGYLRERLACPVINPGLCAVKLAELLVGMGMSHSKLAYPDPPQPVDDDVFTRLASSGEV
jgi:allantoin racemase